MLGWWDRAARAGDSHLDTLPDALLASVALCHFLPLGEERRLAIGVLMAMPLWIVGLCVVYLTRNGWKAWAMCAGMALAMAGLALA